MALYKNDLDEAKKRIYERLDQWIVKTKKKEGKSETGIERLVAKFPNTMRRYRNEPNEESRLVPVTKSYEQRLRSIFINTMSCVPPVIGEYARKLNSASEECFLQPLIERRKTASDNTLGRASKQSVRGRSRQNSRKMRHNESTHGRASNTGINLLTVTNSSDSTSEQDDEIIDTFIQIPVEFPVNPVQKQQNKKNTVYFENKFRKSADIWKPKLRRTQQQKSKHSSVKLEIGQVQAEKEKRKSLGKDGKLKAKRMLRRETRLRRQTILEEKYIKMKTTPFRKLCRIIFHIVALFRITSRQLRLEEKRNTTFERVGTDGEVLSFDPQDYKSASRTYGGLTSMAKRALAKNQSERNEVDIMVLLEVINRMPFFQKYSMSIKRDLAKCLEYDQVESERVIIRQDHPGFRMYFVSSGKLGVRMLMTDPRTGEKIVRQIKEFTPGCYFGELALMRDIKRTATVYCKTTCELLSMTKDNFNKVLRDAWDYLRAERLEILRFSTYFKTWDPQQLEAVADVTELKDYPDNVSIAGDISGISDYVYFITKGDCAVVRRIEMIRQKSPHLESTLHLPEDACGPSFFKKNYGRLWRKQTAEFRFISMFTLHAGDYFAVGEDLTDTFIISKGKVQCLIVSAVQFDIQARTEDLQIMAEARTPMLASNKYLYSELMSTKSWNKYKNGVVNDIVKLRKIPNTTKIQDVPLSIRIQPRVLPKQ